MTDAPLTGSQYEISAGAWRATVTGLGAGLRELTRDGTALITSYDADELPPHASGQLLAPWPNRVDGGRYNFGDHDHQLALSEPAAGNAIHGLTRWAAWTLVAAEPDSVILRNEAHGNQGYPFSVEIDVTYSVADATGLTVETTARNRGSRPAPWGTGQHPYLIMSTEVDEWELTLPAQSWLPSNDRGIPSGPPEDVAGTSYDFRKPRRIGTTPLDTAFTGLSRDDNDRAWVKMSVSREAIGLWADATYRWLQVFTGDALEPEHRRTALAVEPMSCPPNAFVSGDDLVALDPGQSITHTWGITSL
ncbi:MAG: aldose 1-epimerase family protein [Streptosporangiaceae bacterium]|jgi:aldose 1-epimerase